MFLSLLVSVILPIVTLLYCIKMKKTKSFLWGCITFVITQMVLRLPFITFLSYNSLVFNQLQAENTIIYVFLIALSAGLFEEFGRLIVIKFILKNNTSWCDGVVLGLGHGEIEALFLLGLPLLSILTNNTIDARTTDFFIGAVERFFAIILHVGLSVLTMKAAKSNKYIFFIMAILIHTVVDFAVSIIPMFVSNSILILEGSLALISILLLIYIISLRKGWES